MSFCGQYSLTLAFRYRFLRTYLWPTSNFNSSRHFFGSFCSLRYCTSYLILLCSIVHRYMSIFVSCDSCECHGLEEILIHLSKRYWIYQEFSVKLKKSSMLSGEVPDALFQWHISVAITALCDPVVGTFVMYEVSLCGCANIPCRTQSSITSS